MWNGTAFCSQIVSLLHELFGCDDEAGCHENIHALLQLVWYRAINMWFTQLLCLGPTIISTVVFQSDSHGPTGACLVRKDYTELKLVELHVDCVVSILIRIIMLWASMETVVLSCHALINVDLVNQLLMCTIFQWQIDLWEELLSLGPLFVFFSSIMCVSRSWGDHSQYPQVCVPLDHHGSYLAWGNLMALSMLSCFKSLPSTPTPGSLHFLMYVKMMIVLWRRLFQFGAVTVGHAANLRNFDTSNDHFVHICLAICSFPSTPLSLITSYNNWPPLFATFWVCC